MKNYEEIAESVFKKRDKYNEEKARRNKTVKKLSAIMSCFCVAVIACVSLMLGGAFEQDEPKDTAPLADSEGRLLWTDDREKKDLGIVSSESARLWRWEEKTEFEKYFSLKFDGKKYRTRGRAISPALLGEKLGRGTAEGYDDYALLSPVKTKKLDVYEIKGISSDLLVALYFDKTGEYCVFMKDEYEPPKALGEFISAYKLSENLPLTHFSTYKSGKCKGSFALSDKNSDHIWSILEGCAEATFVESYDYYGKERIDFSASSEALGIKNLSFSVTEDGYIFTNIMNYGYCFNIGEDAASKIIGCAKDNGTEAPNIGSKYIVGTVIEIGEDYIIINDSVMMKNERDGKTFTVNAENIKIKRHLSSLSVGSTITVEYDYIYADRPDVIESPLSLAECYISSNGEVLIPE